MTHRVVRTFHSTAMVTDYDATVGVLGRLFGLAPLEYSEAEYLGRRGGMTWIGDNSIEIGQPIVEGHGVDRFVKRFGPGMNSYAYEVDDLDSTIDHLAGHGIGVSVRPADGFCFTDPRATGGLLFEWSDLHEDFDPRYGAAIPAAPAPPVVPVVHHAFVTAFVDDPIEWAETFGPAFGLGEAFRQDGAPLGDPVVGLAASDCVLALHRLPGDEAETLWGKPVGRSTLHALGLTVGDLAAADAALAEAGVGIVRREPGSLVLDPRSTGDVPIVLVEELLPGDPRRPTG